MNTPRTSSRHPRFRHTTLCFAFAAACAAAASGQTGPPRVVVESGRFPNSPIELVGVEVAGAEHGFAEAGRGRPAASFEAGEDWLRQFAFKIRNKSDKAILSVSMSGTIAAGEVGEVSMGIDALYGRELDESAYTGQAPRGEPRRLAPGETAEVRWSAAEYEQVTKFLSIKRPVAAYRRMYVDVREARFEDGTIWAMGRLYRIDPSDPRRWTPLDGRPLTGSTPLRELKAGERLIEADARRLVPKEETSPALAVTAISVNGQSVTPGRPFAAGADWMRGLTLRVKNLSAKPITFIQISFSLPEATYRGGGLGFNFRFGESRLDGQTTPGAKRLPPGEEADLSFTEGEYESNRAFTTARSALTEFSHVRVGTARVTFADGTRASVVSLLGKLAEAAGAK